MAAGAHDAGRGCPCRPAAPGNSSTAKAAARHAGAASQANAADEQESRTPAATAGEPVTEPVSRRAGSPKATRAGKNAVLTIPPTSITGGTSTPRNDKAPTTGGRHDNITIRSVPSTRWPPSSCPRPEPESPVREPDSVDTITRRTARSLLPPAGHASAPGKNVALAVPRPSCPAGPGPGVAMTTPPPLMTTRAARPGTCRARGRNSWTGNVPDAPGLQTRKPRPGKNPGTAGPAAEMTARRPGQPPETGPQRPSPRVTLARRRPGSALFSRQPVMRDNQAGAGSRYLPGQAFSRAGEPATEPARRLTVGDQSRQKCFADHLAGSEHRRRS
jgi:hypothetical protein